MRSPTFDKNGYPTEETLEAISNWPHDNLHALCRFVLEAWNNMYGRSRQNNSVIILATGGWSGNEDIIAALMDNIVFWSRCWKSSHRGGLYIFENYKEII